MLLIYKGEKRGDMESMLIFIAIVSVVIPTFILRRKIKKNRRKDSINWGLGIDNCCFYSPHFSIENNGITIIGYQEMINEKSAIQYSLVKKNWWGKITIYGKCCVYGNYQDPKSFQITLNDIPNGKEYHIEVLIDFNICYGHFKVVA
jgi:hypothetical protein